jgi:hypothetical protein
MVFLDFEKAYNKVKWEFIRLMLEAFGFSKVLFNMMATLFRDALD